jgi:hypothetical protein
MKPCPAETRQRVQARRFLSGSADGRPGRRQGSHRGRRRPPAPRRSLNGGVRGMGMRPTGVVRTLSARAPLCAAALVSGAGEVAGLAQVNWQSQQVLDALPFEDPPAGRRRRCSYRSAGGANPACRTTGTRKHTLSVASGAAHEQLGGVAVHDAQSLTRVESGRAAIGLEHVKAQRPPRAAMRRTSSRSLSADAPPITRIVASRGRLVTREPSPTAASRPRGRPGRCQSRRCQTASGRGGAAGCSRR